MADQSLLVANYTVEVRDQYGRLATVLSKAQQKQFSLYRNKPGSCQFVLDLYDPQAIPQYIQNSIQSIVFRRNNTPVFAGQITYHEPQITDSDAKSVNITATGYMDQLDYRIITEDYPGFDSLHNKLPFFPTDIGQIAWTLINYTQFPIPNADDPDASLTTIADTFTTLQQSFIPAGSGGLQVLKLLMQNSSLYTGNVSSSTSNTLTDNSQSWPANALIGGTVNIVAGTDLFDSQIIASNTANTITLYSPNVNGIATAATQNTLTDTSQNWLPNSLAGRTVQITAGTDLSDAATILGNTNNQLTIVGNFIETPDTTSQYNIGPSIGTWISNPDTSSTYQIIPATAQTTGNVIVSLINDTNGQPRGTVVPNSTVTIPFNQIPNALNWFEIDYPTNAQPQLIAGQTYWINVALDTVQTTGNSLALQVLSNGYYQYGRAYSLQNANRFSADQDIQFFTLMTDNSYQMTKNTYLGILKGTIQSSFNLAPTFDRYKHIKSAIEDLSTTYNGIDFQISVTIDATTNIMTKSFNVYYPGIGQVNTALPFMYPGNIKKLNKPKDGTTLINEVHMRGQGSGQAQLISIQRDVTSIYNFGVRQKDESQPDVSDSPTLDSLAREYVRVNKDPSDLPAIYLDGNMQPTYGTYGIGDWITITASDVRAPILAFNQQYKIEQIDITIDDDGVEEIQLNLGNV